MPPSLKVRMERLQGSRVLVRIHEKVRSSPIHPLAGALIYRCLGLPEWVSLGGWKQDEKHASLPCANLTAFPFKEVPAEWGPTAVM